MHIYLFYIRHSLKKIDIEEEEEEEEGTFICSSPYDPCTKLLYIIHNEIHGHVTMVNYLD